MPFIGNKPSAVPLTSADITDSIITSAKIVDATIANGDIANSTINLTTKVTGTLPLTNGGTGLSALGTAGQALVVNSGATALQYSTVGAGAGQVIQVLGATDSTQRSTTSTSFVTGSNTLSVTITPSSASNKIAIFVHHYTYNDANTTYCTIYRGATNLGGTNGLAMVPSLSGTLETPTAYNYLDSPSTTSATTYQVYFRVNGSSGKICGAATLAQIIVMEIKG